jgi:hypothetical protein
MAPSVRLAPGSGVLLEGDWLALSPALNAIGVNLESSRRGDERL